MIWRRLPPLPPLAGVQEMAKKNNPELAAAFAALDVADKEVTVARAGSSSVADRGLVLRNRCQPVCQR